MKDYKRGEADLPDTLGKVSTVSHFHAAGNDPDEINECPYATSTKSDEHDPPIGIPHQEPVDAQSAQKKADEDHVDFWLYWFFCHKSWF